MYRNLGLQSLIRKNNWIKNRTSCSQWQRANLLLSKSRHLVRLCWSQPAFNYKWKRKKLATVDRVLQNTKFFVILRLHCRGQQRYVWRFITHVHSHCSTNESFVWWRPRCRRGLLKLFNLDLKTCFWVFLFLAPFSKNRSQDKRVHKSEGSAFPFVLCVRQML